MVQVSRRYLKPEISKKILEIFLASFSRLIDDQMIREFFNEFLTPTEKIMLAKRIVCLYLIYKKVSLLEISDVIKISTATAARYHILLEQNLTIKEIFKGILYKEKFMRLIDTFINEYLSSPSTLGRNWKTSHLIHNDYLKRKTSPL